MNDIQEAILKLFPLASDAANKLLALFGRATLRDFIDVYFLIQKKCRTAEELVNDAREKDPGLDLYWLGVAFERIKTYQQDAADMLLLLETVNIQHLQEFFSRWRETIVEKLQSKITT